MEEKFGLPIVTCEVDLEGGQLRDLADAVISQLTSAVVVLGSRVDEKCSLLVRVSDDLVAKGIKAGALVKAAAPLIGGGGGGKPALAQAGGKKPAGLPAALAKVVELLGEQ